jgi:hypothetical protein
MPWFYEIHDSNKVVLEKGEGFATERAATNAGRKAARRLKLSDSSRGSSAETLVTGKATEVTVSSLTSQQKQ